MAEKEINVFRYYTVSVDSKILGGGFDEAR